jgi:predicted histone-like DNA-binding protein
MAVSILPVGKTNPRNPAAPMLYYPTAVKNGEIDLDTLSELIAHDTTLTPADCHAVVVAMFHAISRQLADGNIVRLGHLGSFQVSVKGTGMPTPAAVTPGNVTSAALIFRPGKKFKSVLANLTFTRKK